MKKEILMFFAKTCLNSNAMMPILAGMNFGNYNFQFLDKDDEKAKRVWKKYLEIIKKTGEEESTPIFVDVKENKAAYISNVEDLLAWIEGPEWWKKM